MNRQEAWLLDEDVFIYGYVNDYVFYPNSKNCGFDKQFFTDSDIGVILFYNLNEAIEKYSYLPIVAE